MKAITRELKENYDLEKGSITVNGNDINGYLTDMRVPDDKIPAGFVKYEIRHSDYDDSIFSTIEKKVVVNFAATFITEKKDILKYKKYVEIEDWDWSDTWTDDGNDHTIIDTEYGEVMVKGWFDSNINKSGCDCYIGDNFDQLIGELEIPFDEVTAEDIEKELFPLNC